MNEPRNKPDYPRAKAAARALLIKHYGRLDKVTLPVNLTKIADSLGVSIKAADFSEFDEPVSGAFIKKDKTIFVNMDEPFYRQFFTAAHELGHFKLHGDMEEDVLYRKESTNLEHASDYKEKEANAFAAELVMPEKMVIQEWDKHKDISMLADIFCVSPEAMKYRIQFLDLQ